MADAQRSEQFGRQELYGEASLRFTMHCDRGKFRARVVARRRRTKRCPSGAAERVEDRARDYRRRLTPKPHSKAELPALRPTTLCIEEAGPQSNTVAFSPIWQAAMHAWWITEHISARSASNVVSGFLVNHFETSNPRRCRTE